MTKSLALVSESGELRLLWGRKTADLLVKRTGVPDHRLYHKRQLDLWYYLRRTELLWFRTRQNVMKTVLTAY